MQHENGLCSAFGAGGHPRSERHLHPGGFQTDHERCFEEGKSELGLDHYEHRSWTAWHRHMRLVFLAQLFLIRLQIKFKKNACIDLAASAPAHGAEFSGPKTRTPLRLDPSGIPYTT